MSSGLGVILIEEDTAYLEGKDIDLVATTNEGLQLAQVELGVGNRIFTDLHVIEICKTKSRIC